MKKLLFLGYILFFSVFSQAAMAQQAEEKSEALVEAQKTVKLSEDDKVSHLISYIRNLPGATFIRNGDEYSPGKAADHLQSKWNKHKKKVRTAQDFVSKLATFSSSKEPYQIRLSDGNTVKCGDLLAQELQRIEI